MVVYAGQQIAQQANANVNKNVWGSIIYNVKAYGAKGDGVTDDTAAIQAAINAAQTAGGGTVAIPKSTGDYLYSTDITISGSHIQLVGYGYPTLKKTAACQLKISGSNNLVSGIEFDGNSQGSSGILVTGSYNKIEYCESHDNGSGGHGFCFDGQSTTCDRNWIKDCISHDNGNVGIAQNLATNTKIVDNDCHDNGFEGITIDNQSHRCICKGNRLNANCQNGGVGSIGIDDSTLCSIKGNIITSTGSSLSGIKTQNNLGACNYNSFEGNIILDNPGYGIWLFDGTLGSSAHNIIDGNVLRNNTLGPLRIDASCQYNTVGNNDYDFGAVTNNGSGNIFQTGIVAFLAKNGTARSNVTGDGTTYIAQFDTETLDQGQWNAWDGSTTFTAPIKGTYCFVGKFRVSCATAHNYATIRIVASTAGTFSEDLNATGETVFSLMITTFIPLQKGETVHMEIVAGDGTGTKDATVVGNAQQVWFGGFIVG